MIVTTEMQKLTDVAILFEEKTQDIKMTIPAEVNEAARALGDEPKSIDENKIRKQELGKLRRHMNEQLEKRKYRLMEAEIRRDTNMQ